MKIIPTIPNSWFAMIFDLSIGAAMALVLGIYLVYALLHPEKF